MMMSVHSAILPIPIYVTGHVATVYHHVTVRGSTVYTVTATVHGGVSRGVRNLNGVGGEVRLHERIGRSGMRLWLLLAMIFAGQHMNIPLER